MKAQTILLEQTEPPTPFVQSREQFESILLQLASASTCQMTHSEVEKLVNTDGTELMRRLLQDHLSLRARQEQVVPAEQSAGPACYAGGRERNEPPRRPEPPGHARSRKGHPRLPSTRWPKFQQKELRSLIRGS